MVLELKDGWIQGVGRRELNEVPYKGEFIKFARATGEETLWYEVLEVELPTDAASAGDIVLTLKN